MKILLGLTATDPVLAAVYWNFLEREKAANFEQRLDWEYEDDVLERMGCRGAARCGEVLRGGSRVSSLEARMSSLLFS